jgi:hypothetical protein
MKDREVLWFEDEGTSAYAVPLFKRPAGGRMKAAMTEGDTIVVVRPDRLFRSLKDMAVTMERLSKEKVHVLFAESRMRTDTPTGRLMVSMLSMVAEMESREIGRMSQMGRITSALGDPLKANRVLPSVLNPRPSTESRSRYKFHGVISAEDWRDFHFAYLDAVESNEFGQNEVASSILFNRVLKKYGLPPVAPGDRTLVRAYRGRLKAVPRNEHVEKVLADLKKFKPTGTVSDPIHADRPKRCRLQIKRVRGVMEKMRLSSPAAVILAMGGDPVAAERLVTSLR